MIISQSLFSNVHFSLTSSLVLGSVIGIVCLLAIIALAVFFGGSKPVDAKAKSKSKVRNAAEERRRKTSAQRVNLLANELTQKGVDLSTVNYRDTEALSAVLQTTKISGDEQQSMQNKFEQVVKGMDLKLCSLNKWEDFINHPSWMAYLRQYNVSEDAIAEMLIGRPLISEALFLDYLGLADLDNSSMLSGMKVEACEKFKEILPASTESNVVIEDLGNLKDYQAPLTTYASFFEGFDDWQTFMRHPLVALSLSQIEIDERKVHAIVNDSPYFKPKMLLYVMREKRGDTARLSDLETNYCAPFRNLFYDYNDKRLDLDGLKNYSLPDGALTATTTSNSIETTESESYKAYVKACCKKVQQSSDRAKFTLHMRDFSEAFTTWKKSNADKNDLFGEVTSLLEKIGDYLRLIGKEFLLSPFENHVKRFRSNPDNPKLYQRVSASYQPLSGALQSEKLLSSESASALQEAIKALNPDQPSSDAKVKVAEGSVVA